MALPSGTITFLHIANECQIGVPLESGVPTEPVSFSHPRVIALRDDPASVRSLDNLRGRSASFSILSGYQFVAGEGEIGGYVRGAANDGYAAMGNVSDGWQNNALRSHLVYFHTRIINNQFIVYKLAFRGNVVTWLNNGGPRREICLVGHAPTFTRYRWFTTHGSSHNEYDASNVFYNTEEDRTEFEVSRPVSTLPNPQGLTLAENLIRYTFNDGWAGYRRFILRNPGVG